MPFTSLSLQINQRRFSGQITNIKQQVQYCTNVYIHCHVQLNFRSLILLRMVYLSLHNHYISIDDVFHLKCFPNMCSLEVLQTNVSTHGHFAEMKHV